MYGAYTTTLLSGFGGATGASDRHGFPGGACGEMSYGMELDSAIKAGGRDGALIGGGAHVLICAARFRTCASSAKGTPTG